MTTYVLGAGASFHAGYPLCSALWPQMALWVIETQPLDSEYRRAIDSIGTLYGPVVDVEDTFTKLDRGQGVFQTLSEDQRTSLRGRIRRCLRDYFKSICDLRSKAPLYAALANRIEKGDRIITFNYDVSVENELIGAQKFGVKTGYGSSFNADWDEPDSEVTILKLHGSINWIGVLFGGIKGGPLTFSNSLGLRPFVDNVDSVFPAYPSRVLDKTFPGGGVAGGGTTLVLPTHEKRYSTETSLGNEWIDFFESLWSQATDSLQQAKRIVIIGYSMPEADARPRALLLGEGNKRAELLLCCAGSNVNLKSAFEAHGFWRIIDIGAFSDFLQTR